METVNRLLREAQALPQLLKHDQWDWHLHATTREAPLADRMGTEAAMALVDVIRSKEMDRMLVCAADDCDAVGAGPQPQPVQAVLRHRKLRQPRACGGLPGPAGRVLTAAA